MLKLLLFSVTVFNPMHTYQFILDGVLRKVLFLLEAISVYDGCMKLSWDFRLHMTTTNVNLNYTADV
jgi:hypothetical protein